MPTSSLSRPFQRLFSAEQAVAIAGVMGGVSTEVSSETTRVLLESASFDSRSVRRTSRELKLRSDASGRFERGVDQELAWTALERIVLLLQQIDPAITVSAVADEYPEPVQKSSLSMPYSEVKRLLGMDIPITDAVGILERLDFAPTVTESEDGARVHVTVPTYRQDVNLAADLVEEIARIYGYDALPETLPTGTASRVQRNPERIVDHIVQDALVQAGLQQVQTYTMVSEEDLIALSPSRSGLPEVLGGYPKPETGFVRAVNPLRADWELMRPTLIPSLLKIVAENLKYSERVPVFETARTYQPTGRDDLPDERRAVAIVMAGTREPFGLHRQSSDPFDFLDIKGVIEVLIDRLGSSASYRRIVHPSLHPGRAAAIEVGGQQVGMIGELHPRVAGFFGIDQRVCVAELDLKVFSDTLTEPWSARQVSRFQPVRQDFAIVVNDDVPVSDVEAALRSGSGPLGARVEMFDVYRGEGVEQGKKSLAFRVTLSAPDRQLAEHEIERVRNKIEREVKKRVGGLIRT